MKVLVVLMVAAAALVQAAAGPALFAHPLAAPVLPAAIVVAWAAMRGPEETWAALPLPAVVMGALSDERAGWFLIALLPAPLLGMAVARRARRTGAGLVRRVAWSAGAAGGAALCYGLVLVLAAGVLRDLPAATGDVAAGVLLTGLLGAPLALLAWPARRRERGLFS